MLLCFPECRASLEDILGDDSARGDLRRRLCLRWQTTKASREDGKRNEIGGRSANSYSSSALARAICNDADISRNWAKKTKMFVGRSDKRTGVNHLSVQRLLTRRLITRRAASKPSRTNIS